jgi:hypothetical protein
VVSVKAATRKVVQVASFASLVIGVVAGAADLWGQGTYSLVVGALGLWAVDRWDDLWGPS